MATFASYAHPGPRENLEDATHALALRSMEWGKAQIGLLCDGVGGRCKGEVASAIATHVFCGTIAAELAVPKNGKEWQPDEIIHLLETTFEKANVIILKASATPGHGGMATTAVCFIVLDGTLYVAWRGDSRCYLWSGKQLTCLTRDHSEAMELVDAGVLTEEEACRHPASHTITRYLGQQAEVATDTLVRPIFPGDLIMACSDGLTDVLADTEIAAELRCHFEQHRPFKAIPEHLVQLALERGTHDNTTVLCCCYEPTLLAYDTTHPGTETEAYSAAMAGAMQELEVQHEHA